ncbi:protein AATF [Danaus plexippus]|uniref:protein AATF n=1 Tax=Danaus plexippus TaxID=13037 RepID=UPI002AB25673|nr:protein AATF [Danaus plexippus]
MKFKQKKSSKLTLSDKIADALTVKPRADIEDDVIFGTKPNTVSRADYSSDSEDEDAISDFRKRNVNLLSEISKKYEGQVVSRKEFDRNSADESVDDESDGQQSEQEISKNLKGLMSDDEESQGSDDSIIKNVKSTVKSDDSSSEDGESDDYDIVKHRNEDESDEDGSEEEGGFDISQMEEPVKEEFEHVKKQNVSEEAKKGMAVRNQLLLWEGLLEMRIHLQRCMNSANRMPMSDTYETLKNHSDFVEESGMVINNVANVLDKFLNLQSLLLKQYPETKTISNKKITSEAQQKQGEGSDEEIPSDTDNEEIPSDTESENDQPQMKADNKKTNEKKRKLEDYESDIATTHKAFKSYRDATVKKWNEKTRLATAANIKSTPTNTILQQISYILSDRDKLIRRTQLKRSEYDIIGYKKDPTPTENRDQNGMGINPITRDRKDNDVYIPEIFDDSDFYHQLLRELIECKSADISDPVQLSRQWIALQQMRSKMKRKVDTRATKGRKIKYVVHNKLVSYMAPEKSITWTDESTNELYNSLFGKMFESNNVGTNINLDNVKLFN